MNCVIYKRLQKYILEKNHDILLKKRYDMT